MKTVLLKRVAEEDWTLFKSEAVTHNMYMGEFLSYLIREHTKKHDNSRWKKILSYRSGRSKEEINAHEESIKKFRETFNLRR